MSSALEEQLASAQASLSNKDAVEAVRICKDVLAQEPASYEGYIMLGKAFAQQHDVEQAEEAFTKATELKERAPQAWFGLAEVATESKSWVKAAEAYQALVDMAYRGSGQLAGQLVALTKRLAHAHQKAGDLARAEAVVKEVLSKDGFGHDDWLDCMCLLADIQLLEDARELEQRVERKLRQITDLVREKGQDVGAINVDAIRAYVEGSWAYEALEMESDHASHTLKDIVVNTPPSPKFAMYHDAYLRRLRRAIQVAPAGSMARHHARTTVLAQCKRILDGRSASQVSGCTSPYAYETALYMLEIESDICGTAVRLNSMDVTGITSSMSALSMFQTPSLSYMASPMLSASPSYLNFGAATPNLAALAGYSISGHGSIGGSHGGLMSPKSHVMSPRGGAGPQLLPWKEDSTLMSGNFASALPTIKPESDSGLPTVTAAGNLTAMPLLLQDNERVGVRMYHAFPWHATAQSHLALALRRRAVYLATPRATIKRSMQLGNAAATDVGQGRELAHAQARRGDLIALLQRSIARGAPAVVATIGLAELQLEAGNYQGALDAAKQGVKMVFQRSKKGHERMRHAGMMLNLLAAQALQRMGRAEEAGRMFGRLATKVSEGEVAFGELAGLPPISIRQQAIRGLAQIALDAGNVSAAKQHYEELVAKALMGRGTAEPWAWAEYGWLLFEEGSKVDARSHFETALDMLDRTDVIGHEQQQAEYHHKLGRIYWDLGGELRAGSDYAHAQFMAAAAIEGPFQAQAFAWLGRWYREVAGDGAKANKCLKQAAEIDPAAAQGVLQAEGDDVAELSDVMKQDVLLAPDVRDTSFVTQQLSLPSKSKTTDAGWL